MELRKLYALIKAGGVSRYPGSGGEIKRAKGLHCQAIPRRLSGPQAGTIYAK